MDMNGEYRINAPRTVVWAALNNPDILKQSIPGCEELTRGPDNEFSAQVLAKVGPVKAKFSGRVKLSDLDPPNGYTINGEGAGGAAGFAKGGAKVRLEDTADGTGTLLRYEVYAQIGGKLAQIGARLIDGAASKMASEFFTAFATVVEAQPESMDHTPPPATEGLHDTAVSAMPPHNTGRDGGDTRRGYIAAGLLFILAMAIPLFWFVYL